jgi:hypothetical protein
MSWSYNKKLAPNIADRLFGLLPSLEMAELQPWWNMLLTAHVKLDHCVAQFQIRKELLYERRFHLIVTRYFQLF